MNGSSVSKYFFKQVNRKPGDRPSETNHELYVMQTLFLNLLEEKRQMPVDSQVLNTFTNKVQFI